MRTKPIIQMTFSCDQDWEQMRATSCGRFCDVCKKEVIDFSNKPISGFDHLKGSEFCGRFSATQLDQSLTKAIRLPFSRKIALYFAALSLTFTAKDSAAGSEKQKIEIVDQKSNRDNSDNYLPEENTVVKTLSTANDHDKLILTTKKRKYYWSSRFPFIRVVKIRACGTRMGNVRYL